MERREAYFYDPCRGPLLATKHSLCPDDTRGGVHRAVDDIHGHDMRTMGIRVLMPHSDDDMRP